jgi:hypothetical protein
MKLYVDVKPPAGTQHAMDLLCLACEAAKRELEVDSWRAVDFGKGKPVVIKYVCRMLDDALPDALYVDTNIEECRILLPELWARAQGDIEWAPTGRGESV